MEKLQGLVDQFLNELHAQKNIKRALWDQNYHKSKRVHLGVSVPVLIKMANQYCKALSEDECLEFAKNLWKTDIFDAMISAEKILSRKQVTPSNKLWEMVLFFLQDVDGWALEDQLQPVASKCIIQNEALLDELEVWTDDTNFWIRRAALVYTLPFAKENKKIDRMLSWMAKYAKEDEWFIQKAIGWWLRVLSKKNPETVTQFVQKHQFDLKPVAKKEALRKIPLVKSC